MNKSNSESNRQLIQLNQELGKLESEISREIYAFVKLLSYHGYRIRIPSNQEEFDRIKCYFRFYLNLRSNLIRPELIRKIRLALKFNLGNVFEYRPSPKVSFRPELNKLTKTKINWNCEPDFRPNPRVSFCSELNRLTKIDWICEPDEEPDEEYDVRQGMIRLSPCSFYNYIPPFNYIIPRNEEDLIDCITNIMDKMIDNEEY